MMRKGNSRPGRTPWIAALLAIPMAAALAAPAHAAPAPADPILLWNQQTNQSIQMTSMDPFQATRALALESIAVLDTLRSVAAMPGFMVRLAPPAAIDPAVAAQAAAHATLVSLFPARRAALDATFDTALAAVPADEHRRQGVAFGEAIAAAVIAIRDRDGWDHAGPVRTGTEPGQWRPTPPRFYPPLDPQWATLVPFTLSAASQFRPPGPPAPGTQAFNDARRQTATLGAADSPVRTADQTLAAHYWSDAIGTYAPAGHWNAIAATVVHAAKFDSLAEATVFAELNVAIADAAIAMADAKYTYWAWRPITAIRAGDADFPAQPAWTPLLETPNHPTYISGHSAFSAAAAVVLTSYFGARPFRAGSVAVPGVSRDFRSFEQAAEEAADSRLWGGIHYKFDNDDGLVTGRAVGRWAMAAFRDRSQDHGPVIIVDRKRTGGFAFDSVAPVIAVEVALDDGPHATLPVDARGHFTLPQRAAGPHALTLTATSAGDEVAIFATTVTGGE